MAADVTLTGPESLTPAWLTAALRANGILTAGAIQRVAVSPLGDNEGTTGRLYRIRLEYGDGASSEPSSLIAKFPREDGPALAVARRFRLYEREASFYEEVAPIPVRTPRLYLRAASTAGDPVLLLEDMAPAREGDPIAGTGSNVIGPIVDAVARAHARYWGSVSLASMPWLPRPNAPVTVAYSREHFAPAWRRFRASLPLPDGVLEAGERLCGDRSVLDRMSLDPCTLTHGDLRLNNLMFSEDGRFSAAIDWQSVTFARGPGDLAALLIGNMSPTACAASEDELVRQYHDRLIASGVTGYGFEACWSDYRLGALAHFASMVMLSAFMDLGGNRGETADAIVGRPVAAVERLCLAELLPRRRAGARIVARVRAAFGRG